jgi:glycolate oxidase FAD binding subunit
VRAREEHLAVVPSGGGTKLGWANPLDAKRVVRLDLRRLRDASLDPDEGIATVGAGLAVEDLVRAASETGKRVLCDASRPGATLGGTLASDPVTADASLDRRPPYEALGVTAALTNGTVAVAGGKVVKNVTGFDLVRLYAGSFGTLCVITELVLRLRPIPERRRVTVLEAGSLGAALAVAHEVRLDGEGPEGLAILPATPRPRLLCLLEGADADVARRAEHGPGEAGRDEDWEEVQRALGEEGVPAPCRLRLAARPSDTGELAAEVADVAGAEALRLLLPRPGIALADVDEDAAARLFDVAASHGWVIRIERAPLEVRQRLDVFGPEPTALPLMRSLKQRFDPDRILSPGRFVGRI